MTDTALGYRTGQAPRFLSVPAAARMLGVSAATLYRCIAADEFPAVRIRTRIVVPVEAVERMRQTAMREGRLVDAGEGLGSGDAA